MTDPTITERILYRQEDLGDRNQPVPGDDRWSVVQLAK